MDGTNCTFYMDGATVIRRARIDGVFTFGLAVAIDNTVKGGVTTLPGVPAHLIDIDKDVENLKETIYNEDGRLGAKLHNVSDWIWRNIDIVCDSCGLAWRRSILLWVILPVIHRRFWKLSLKPGL